MRLCARLIPFDALTPGLLAEWHRLDRETIEPNVYLSPNFVIPAVHHLTPDTPPILALVEDLDAPDGTRLQLLGLLRSTRHSRALPLRHFRAYRTLHTFGTGLLVAPQAKEATMRTWVSHLMNCRPRHHGLDFDQIRADQPVFRLLRATAAELDMEWFELQRFHRAVLEGSAVKVQGVRMPKDVRRNLRRLQQAGQVEHRIVGPGNTDPDCIERHLALEYMGWKSEAGTAMLCRPSEAAFFRKMAANFLADGRAVFSELLINGEVIASTSNFASGSTLFGFKAGFNPALSSYGPGIINEVKFLESAISQRPGLTSFDSGTAGPSYIDRLLPDRSPVVTGFFSLSGVSKPWLRMVARAWPIKNRLRTRWTATDRQT